MALKQENCARLTLSLLETVKWENPVFLADVSSHYPSEQSSKFRLKHSMPHILCCTMYCRHRRLFR